MKSTEELAKKTLSDIIDTIGADPKYKNYALLISYIEYAIKAGK